LLSTDLKDNPFLDLIFHFDFRFPGTEAAPIDMLGAGKDDARLVFSTSLSPSWHRCFDTLLLTLTCLLVRLTTVVCRKSGERNSAAMKASSLTEEKGYRGLITKKLNIMARKEKIMPSICPAYPPTKENCGAAL
jgi:hypothetical protein